MKMAGYGMGMRGYYAGSQVSSATNDPNTAHMRVFVGNINTGAITKHELQEIFGPYGKITGISIHKGFAFIQYVSVASARAAVQNENGNYITDQVADINIASEPKPTQKAFASAGNDSYGTGYEGYEGYGGDGYGTGYAADGYGSVIGAGWAGAKRGIGRGMRGGMMRGRGRGLGGGNKVASGRIQKNSNKVLNTVKQNVTQAKSIITAPSGNKMLNLTTIRDELAEVRDNINALLTAISASGTLALIDSDNKQQESGAAGDNNYNGAEPTEVAEEFEVESTEVEMAGEQQA